MERKVKYASNRWLILGMLAGAFMVWMGVEIIRDGEVSEGLLAGLLGAFIMAGVFALMPFCYRFDNRGVSICYLFFPKERYLWDNIRDIQVDYHSRQPTAFRLDGKPEGKHRFYMTGEIFKTRRTKRLLEEYWDGEITGYFFEGARKRFRRRKEKKTGSPAISTGEVVALERAVREETRNALGFHMARAAQLGLELRIRYCYTTNDWEESHSRPAGSYQYTVVAELSRPGETDESRIVTAGAYPIHVRLGKKAYRSVKDDSAIPELQQELAEVLEEVAKNGLDAYCQE